MTNKNKIKMSFINKYSNECANSDLDLFSVPPTQTSLESAKIVEYQPIASITNNGPIEFSVTGSDEDYVDASQIFLYLLTSIKKNKTEAVGDDDVIAPCNLFLHALFQQIDVILGGKKISSSINTYPYRAMIETLLNYGSEAKSTQLASALFHKDTNSRMDSISLTGDTVNYGFLKRRNLAKKKIELYGKLHTDIGFQNRYIINNINMFIRLIRSPNSFCLIGDTTKDQFDVRIDEALLYVRKVKVNPQVMLAHAMALEKATLKYPLTRVETTVHTILSGTSYVGIDNISSAVIPKRVVFGLVEADAANGNFSKNCFNFKHFNLTQVSLTVDGVDVPQSPINININENNSLRAYYSMFHGLDRAGLDWGNQITKDEFLSGYALFVFDLSPDKCNGEHFNLIKKGNLKLKLTFKTPTPYVINCYIYMEYDNILEITKERNVIFDYAI